MPSEEGAGADGSQAVSPVVPSNQTVCVTFLPPSSHLYQPLCPLLVVPLPRLPPPPQASKECNDALLNLQPSEEGAGAEGGQKVDTAAVLAVISREIRSEQEPTRLEALRWIHFLLVR